MKRIAIFGSYNGGSIGDNAILFGLLNCIFDSSSDIEVTILTMKRCVEFDNEFMFDFNHELINECVVSVISGSGTLIGRIRDVINLGKLKLNITSVIDASKLSRELSNVDLLIIGGGNLLMDYYPGWPRIMKDICYAAKKLDIPYYFVGVGAGPISNDSSSFIFKDIIESAQACYVRDNNSRDILEKVGVVDNVNVSVDLAFGIDVSKSLLSSVEKDRISINIAAVYAEGWPEVDSIKFNAYINQALHLTNSLVAKYKIKKVEVFSSNYPLDNYACDYFLKRLPDCYEVVYTNKRLTVSDIIQINQRAVASLVTRLHAGIMASKFCDNIYAIAYQPKVEAVLKQSSSNLQVFEIFKDFEVGGYPCRGNENNLAVAKSLITSIVSEIK